MFLVRSERTTTPLTVLLVILVLTGLVNSLSTHTVPHDVFVLR